MYGSIHKSMYIKLTTVKQNIFERFYTNKAGKKRIVSKTSSKLLQQRVRKECNYKHIPRKTNTISLNSHIYLLLEHKEANFHQCAEQCQPVYSEYD